jgi:CHRD domain
MKYVNAFALVVSLAAAADMAGCSNSDSPSSPSGNVTQTFVATLRPSEETPPITGAESTGGGTATITLSVAKDQNGNVTSGTAAFDVNLNGFPAGTPVNMAHIHQAQTGQSGNVVVSTTLAPGEVMLTNGSGSFNRNGIAVTPDIVSQLLSNPAGFYFNVHSTLNPGGVARGQLVRVQ